MIFLEFCAACGEKGKLHHHHLIPRSRGGSDGEANLITLCRECHAKVHGLSVELFDLLEQGRKRARAKGIKFGPKFKLTPDQKEEALARRDAVETLKSIGDSFNVSYMTISRL